LEVGRGKIPAFKGLTEIKVAKKAVTTKKQVKGSRLKEGYMSHI
jgi:hypothetical protein